MGVNKNDLIKIILRSLETDLEKAKNLAKESRDAVIDEETRPENEYDTRAIEASYLAGAQAHRVRDLEGQIHILKQVPALLKLQNEKIGPFALVQLEADDGKDQWVFLLPQGGGIHFNYEGRSIQVVTPHSPLGEELIGLKVGDIALVEHKGVERELEVLAID